jgi:hypothetical protein
MMTKRRNQITSALALTLLLGAATACSTTFADGSASPGGTDVRHGGDAWDRDICAREGGVWREWRCDRPGGG